MGVTYNNEVWITGPPDQMDALYTVLGAHGKGYSHRINLHKAVDPADNIDAYLPCCIESEGTSKRLRLQGLTLYSVPFNAYISISKRFPGIVISVRYIKENLCDAGMATFANGRLVRDIHIDDFDTYEAGAEPDNTVPSFQIDQASSDDQYCYVDVAGIGTVVIKKDDEGLAVDVYPLHVVDDSVAGTWVLYSELIREGPAK